MYDFGLGDLLSSFLELNDEMERYSSALNDVYASQRRSAEIAYQQKHKKVQDRYGTTKFYGNNIKHKKRRK